MNPEVKPQQIIRDIYRNLAREWGPQHWWPAETPFEVIVGAILTQNTSWGNVERAIRALREADALNMDRVRRIPHEKLEQLIRSSGYFRQKSARLKEFVAFVDWEYGGSLERMLARPTDQLRRELIALKGIGAETADSILLYAGQHPIFVVDAYTRRVLERHDAVAANARYDEIRELVESALEGEECVKASGCEGVPKAHSPSAMSTATRTQQAQVYNEMHGLFVQLGKHYCTKKEPDCKACPLGVMLGVPAILRESEKSRKKPSGQGTGASKSKLKQRYNKPAAKAKTPTISLG